MFEGYTRFCFVRRFRDGSGPGLAHRPSGECASVEKMFGMADRVFGGTVDALDIFVAETEQEDWYLDGPGVPPEFSEA